MADFQRWMSEAKRLNPDYSEEELSAVYQEKFGGSPAVEQAEPAAPAAKPDPDKWLSEAQKLNPDYTPYELRQAYESRYGSSDRQPEPETNPEDKFERSWGEAATDYGKKLASGFNMLVGGAGHYIGLAGEAVGVEGAMDNPWTRAAKGVDDALKSPEKGMSPGYRAREAAAQAEIDTVPDDEVLAKTWKAIEVTATDPVLASSMVVEQLPMLYSLKKAAPMFEALGGLLGLGAKAASKLTTAGMVGTGAALQGADVGQDAYQRIKDLPDELWDAKPGFKELAAEVGRERAKEQMAVNITAGVTAAASAISVGAQFLPGGRTIERALAGKTAAGGLAKGLVKGAAGEGISEGVEEGFGQVSANVGIQQVDPNASLTQGVGQAAGQGAVLGAALGGPAGGLMGAAQGAQAAQQKATEDAMRRVQGAQTADEMQAAVLDALAVPDASVALPAPDTVLSEGVSPGGTPTLTPNMIAGPEGVRPQRATDLAGLPEQRALDANFASPEGASTLAGVMNRQEAAAPEMGTNVPEMGATGAQPTQSGSFRSFLSGLGTFKVERSNVAQQQQQLAAFSSGVNTMVSQAIASAQASGRPAPALTADFEATVAPHEMVPGGSKAVGLGKMFGLNVVFFNQKGGGSTVNGAVSSEAGQRVIFINAKAKSPVMQVFGHELTHWMERDAIDAGRPELYTQFIESMKPFFPAGKLAEIENRYGSLGNAVKEGAADIAGTVWTNEGFWNSLSRENPSVFERVAATVLRFIESIKAKLGTVPLAKEVAGEISKLEQLVAKYTAQHQQLVASGAVERGRARTAEQARSSENAQRYADRQAEEPAAEARAQEMAGEAMVAAGGQGVDIANEQYAGPRVSTEEVTHHSQVQQRDGEGKFSGPVQKIALSTSREQSENREQTSDRPLRSEADANREMTPRPADARQRMEQGGWTVGANFSIATEEDFTRENIEGITQKDGWAILTAENPNNTEQSDEENVAATGRLRQRLRDEKLKHIEVRGRYSEGERPEERSFVVFANKRQAMALGVEFGQESILTREGLVYQSGKVDPATGKVNVFDEVPENYYTRIPGEPWAFSVDIQFSVAENEDTEVEEDPDGLSKQTIMKAAKRIAAETGYAPIREQTPESLATAVRRLKKDVLHELKRDRNAAEWYRENLKDALRQVASIYPEITRDPAARQAFIAALAITSNGTTIAQNVFAAFDLYTEYRKDPSAGLPVRGTGVRRVNMEKAISKFNELVEVLGPTDAAGFLATPFKAGDLNQMVKISGWPADYEIYGSAIFGPKIGHGFFSNLSGRYDALTMDRWFFRTWGRVTGTLIRPAQKKNKKTGLIESIDKLAEGQISSMDRAFAHDAIRQLVEELNAEGYNMTVAGVQAILWYHEKALYESHGAVNEKAKPTDYATEVRAFIENHGLEPVEELGGRRDAGLEPLDGEGAAREVPWEEQGVGGVDIPFSLPEQAAVRPGREGSVNVDGIHFGRERGLPALSGGRFGSGISGAERERLSYAKDPRIKRRVYFYIRQPGGFDVKRREAGLGGHVYAASLSNLYEQGVSPSIPRTPVYSNEEFRIVDQGETSNRWESAVLDAGYDGYLVRNPDIAVVLNRDVPVKYLGQLGQQPPIQFAIAPPVESAKFKQYWKGSKVEKKGKPIVLYHGTNAMPEAHGADFQWLRSTAFDGGRGDMVRKLIWGAEKPNLANVYAGALGEYKGERFTAPRVLPVYMAIKNPLDLDAAGVNSSYDMPWEKFLDKLPTRLKSLVRSFGLHDLFQYTSMQPWHYITHDGFIEALIEAGYDGVKVPESNNGMTWAAVEETQVKSVFNETFSTTDPRMSLSVAEDRFAADMDAQAKFLTDYAVREGYATLESWIAADGAAFARAAQEWRDSNPRIGFSIDETIDMSDFPLPEERPTMEVGIAEDLQRFRETRELTDDDYRFIGDEWLKLAANPDNFTFPISFEEDLSTIAFEMGGREVRVASRPASAEDKRYYDGRTIRRVHELKVGAERNAKAWIYEFSNGEVALNVSLLKQGGTSGALVYQITNTWAANSGKVFIGDPAGLSKRALFRRTVNMFSGALRSGKTTHLEPHQNQLDAGLLWRKGDDSFNIGQMAVWIRDTLALYAPHSYDPEGFDATSQYSGAGSFVPTADVNPATAAGGARTRSQTAITDGILAGVVGIESDPRAGVSVRPSVRALDPNNRGLVDGALLSLAPGFYSALERGVEQSTTAAAPAAGWKQFLNTLVNKGQIKRTEIEWTGVEEWLDLQKGKVTKESLQQYLAENGVRVEEEGAGFGYLPAKEINERDRLLYEARKKKAEADQRIQELYREHGYEFPADSEPGIELEQLFEVMDEADREVEEIASYYTPDSTGKYGQYTTNGEGGGKDYVELLLTLPPKKIEAPRLSVRPEGDGWVVWDDANDRQLDDMVYPSSAAAIRVRDREALNSIRADRARTTFQSTHFDEPNVLAHMRFNTRMTPDGKKVMFIEEVQSDWAQAGRDEGFGVRDAKVQPDVRVEYNVNSEMWEILGRNPGGQEEVIEQYRGEQDAMRAAEDLNKETAEVGVPPAPFVETTEAWVTLVLKRALRWAIDRGFDKVAWTPGIVQQQRYSLRNRATAIEYIEQPNMQKGRLIAWNGSNPLIEKEVERDKISRYVGKTLAERLLNNMEEDGFGGSYSVIEGERLDIGGEGMIKFYDEILPNAANKLLKKVKGGRVGRVEFPAAAKASVAHGFDITPEMVTTVSAGQPLFSLPSAGQQYRDIDRRAREQQEVDPLSVQQADIDRAAADFEEFRRTYKPSAPPSGPMFLGSVPHALRMLGVTPAPLRASASVVEKALVAKHAPEFKGIDMRAVIEGLHRPAVIMQSEDGGYEIVTGVEDAFGNPVMWAVHPDVPTQRGTNTSIIKTVFGARPGTLRDRYENVKSPRKLLYVDESRLGAMKPVDMASFRRFRAGAKGVLGPRALEQWIKNHYSGPESDMPSYSIAEPNRSDYTPEQEAFFKRVGRDTPVRTWKDRLAEIRKDFWRRLRQGAFDQFDPIKSLSETAYALARLSKGTSGAIEAFMKYGKLRIEDGVYGSDMSGGFIQRVGVALQGETDDFLWWIAANRAEQLTKEERENLFTAADIAAGKSLADGELQFDYRLQNGARAGQTTRSRAEAYADALVTFNEFNRNALDMAEQSGLIDRESRGIWEREFYVPFYRVSEEEGFIGQRIKSGLTRQKAFQKLKGGDQKLHSDLLHNVLSNWSHLIDAAAKNRAALATSEAAVAAGVAIEADAATIRQMGRSIQKRNDVYWVMDGGQARFFLVDDPAVMAAISSLEYAGLRGPIMDALSWAKHTLTVGVTASPAFKVRNLIRDSVQAIAVSDLSYNPFANVIEGFKAGDRQSQSYVDALASGGLIRFGTMIEGSHSARVKQLIKQGMKGSHMLDSEGAVQKLWDTVLEPALMAYNELGNRGEEINRMALFVQLQKQGKSKAEAALLARDLMDFSMQGTWASIRFLTQVVPFMNARLQGLYKLGRGAQDNPKKMVHVLLAAAAVSIGLLALYHDDDDWKRREDWDRDNYWWFKLGGIAYRIPKPFEIGALATLAERGVELFTDPEMTGGRATKLTLALLGNQLAMNPVPQAVKPIIDLYANKDSFTGRPIETMGMERLLPDYRFTASTSMAARAISSTVQGGLRAAGMERLGARFLSPVQIDHVFRGYFAWLGTFIVGMADMPARPLSGEPSRRAPDWWKLGSQGFLSELPSSQSRYVTKVYDQLAAVEEAYATHRELIKQGRSGEAQAFARENKDALREYQQLKGFRQQFSKINQQIRMVERSQLSPAEKKRRIDELQQRKARLAERSLRK